MPIGNQPTVASVNQDISSCATQLRNVMQLIRNKFEELNGIGAAGLQAIGFSATDAPNVLTQMGYMNQNAQVYYGVLFSGTTATNGVAFDFDNELSAYWGDQ